MACVCHSLAACQRHTPSSLAAVISLSNNGVILLRSLRCVALPVRRVKRPRQPAQDVNSTGINSFWCRAVTRLYATSAPSLCSTSLLYSAKVRTTTRISYTVHLLAVDACHRITKLNVNVIAMIEC